MRLHSWMSPKCAVRNSPLGGVGVFASETIQRHELVSVWGGMVYTAEEVDRLGRTFPNFRKYPVRVFDGFYLGSTSLTAIDDAERFNHGCEPNIGVKGQIIVLARRRIEADEELLFDYETTDTAPEPFECRCGTERCRGLIDGSAWGSSDFLQRNVGWLAWSATHKIKQP